MHRFIGVLIISIVLMLTLDMQLYAVSMAAGLMGIALAAYFIVAPVVITSSINPVFNIASSVVFADIEGLN